MAFDKQRYLIKTKSGDRLQVFLRDFSIMYYNCDNEDISVACQKLINDPVINYDIRIDDNDNLHIICLTNDGGFKYYHGKIGEELLGTYLALIDLKNNLMQNLSLLVAGNNIHLFRTLTSPNNPAFSEIFHSIWNGRGWQEHYLGDITTSNDLPSLIVDKDSQDNIHLWYSSMAGNGYYQTYYKRFNSIFSVWSETEKLDLPENTQKIFALIDSDDTLHFLSSSLNKNNNRLQYRRLQNSTWSTSNWSSAYILTDSLNTNSWPFLLSNEQRVGAIWEEKDIFLKNVSLDSGLTWGEPEIIEVPGNSTIVPYLNNDTHNGKNIKTPYIFGVTDPRLQLSVIIDDLMSITGEYLESEEIGQPLHEEKDTAADPEKTELSLPAPEQEPAVADNELMLSNAMENITNMVRELHGYCKNINIKAERAAEQVNSFQTKLENIEVRQSEILTLLNNYRLELNSLTNHIERNKNSGIFNKLFP